MKKINQVQDDLLKLSRLFKSNDKSGVRLAGITETLQDCDGSGVILWFKGCPFGCPGCHNPDVAMLNWDTGFTINFGDLTAYLMKYLDWVEWIVFSGGEPLLQPDAVKAIGHWAKEHKDKKLWLYTGYEFEELAEDIKEIFDVIKCGKFVQELRDESLRFRGSSNQRLFRKHDGNWEAWS